MTFKITKYNHLYLHYKYHHFFHQHKYNLLAFYGQKDSFNYFLLNFYFFQFCQKSIFWPFSFFHSLFVINIDLSVHLEFILRV